MAELRGFMTTTLMTEHDIFVGVAGDRNTGNYTKLCIEKDIWTHPKKILKAMLNQIF